VLNRLAAILYFLTALATLIIGTPKRFRRGKQIGSYVGLIPEGDSSAGHQRLGHNVAQMALRTQPGKDATWCRLMFAEGTCKHGQEIASFR